PASYAPSDSPPARRDTSAHMCGRQRCRQRRCGRTCDRAGSCAEGSRGGFGAVNIRLACTNLWSFVGRLPADAESEPCADVGGRMARENMRARGVKPEQPKLLTLEVLRTERLSKSFSRVTLGRGDIDEFVYMGFDQWFRLFIPVSEDSLARLPAKLDTLAYMRYLTISKTSRPVLRNYTVAAYRPEGP